MIADSPLRGRSTVVLAVLANAIPIVGVFTLGWEVLPVLALYWIEAVAYVCQSAIEALFAVRPVDDDFYGIQVPLERLREKCGHVTVVNWLPPIYPRNIPFALNAGWLLFGLAAVATLVLAYVVPAGSLAGRTLFGVAGGTVLVVCRHAAALHEFLKTRRYECHTALSTFSRRRSLAVAIPGFLLPLFAAGAERADVGLAATLAVVVGAKLVVDVLDLTASGGEDVSSGDAAAELVAILDGDPIAVVHTDDRGVVLGGLGLGVLLSAMPPYGFVLLFAAVGTGLAFGLIAGASVLFALVVGRALLEIPIARLLYGAVEYRVYAGSVVAYDVRLDAPQWSVPRNEISNVKTKTALTSSFVSGAFGKVRFVRDDDSKLLSVVEDPEAFARQVSS